MPPTRAAIGYPDIPGLPFSDRILNPVVRYDFGPGFNAVDLSGVMSIVPPRIVGVIPTYVPRVNEDGNETAGVPVGAAAGAARHLSRLEHDPLGRLRRTGLRLPGRLDSVREDEGRAARATTIRGCRSRSATARTRPMSRVVKRAADQAVRDRFLLPEDADRFVREAEASDVLTNAVAVSGPQCPAGVGRLRAARVAHAAARDRHARARLSGR